ncbi:ISL3 family transposase [Puniceicoccus vermicola]|uniref:ISL3 family transposase n=1 Tax=Puniceicoccus vermicola TaxID=388746 RepID=UPI0033952E1D
MNNLTGIAGYEVISQRCKSDLDELEAVLEREPERCPYCAAPGPRSKGRYLRKVRHRSGYGRSTFLLVHTRRFWCWRCKRSFLPTLPGIRPYRQSSELFRKEVHQRHEDGICASTLAKRERIGQATVERIYHQHTELEVRKRSNRDCPRMLGIDEHTLGKKNRFCTTFCDLGNNRVFEVRPGRSEKELSGFLASLPGREKVEVVCIDLSQSYRKLVRRWFPKARIVADRFHAVRVLAHHFTGLCREIAPEITRNSGLLAILRTRPGRLSQKQIRRRQELFDKHPTLEPLYLKRWQIHSLLCQKSCTAKKCRSNAKELYRHIEELQQQGFAQLKTLAKTLQQWIEPIATMWRFTKNNAITEGFHRKMKLIQRRAFGFRNFENYRLRVLAQCQ